MRLQENLGGALNLIIDSPHVQRTWATRPTAIRLLGASQMTPEELKDIREDCHVMFENYLSGKRGIAANQRRSIRKRLRASLAKNPEAPEAWLQLGDLYIHNDKRLACFRKALKYQPGNVKAHAEIADCLAQRGDRRFAKHVDEALRSRRKGLDDDLSILTCQQAADLMGDSKRSTRAFNLGKRLYPKSDLFSA